MSSRNVSLTNFEERPSHDPDPSLDPHWPQSMEDLIMTYHRAHSNSLRLAHIINSRQGTSSSVTSDIRLAEYFQHVHASSEDPIALAAIRKRIGHWYASNWWKGTFTFSTARVEDIDECVATGSTDFVGFFMNMHEIDDVEAAVRSAADSLTPNGTLAIVTFSPSCKVVGNEELDVLVRSLFAEKALRTRPNQLERLVSPLDYVALPEDLFIQEVTKRIKVNFWGGNDAFILPGYKGPTADSRVHPGHRLYRYNDGDPEGAGWRKEVDINWFRLLVSQMVGSHDLHAHEHVLQEIEQKIQACPGHKITVEWAAAVLLGTRK